VDSPDSLLPLYEAIREIREKDLNQIVIAEKVITKKQHFQLSVKEGHLEKDIERSWILVEFDHGDDSCNFLTLEERLVKGLAGLPPAFQGCEMVALLSSKAGLKNCTLGWRNRTPMLN
jgi:hypothetical protein